MATWNNFHLCQSSGELTTDSWTTDQLAFCLNDQAHKVDTPPSVVCKSDPLGWAVSPGFHFFRASNFSISIFQSVCIISFSWFWLRSKCSIWSSNWNEPGGRASPLRLCMTSPTGCPVSSGLPPPAESYIVSEGKPCLLVHFNWMNRYYTLILAKIGHL